MEFVKDFLIYAHCYILRQQHLFIIGVTIL